MAVVCKDWRTAWENGDHKLHDVERSGVLEYDRTADGISGYKITVAGGIVCATDYGKGIGVLFAVSILVLILPSFWYFWQGRSIYRKELLLL